jgi:S-adenosylmethionine hydrolase
VAPLITFLTDFGLRDDFVGTCHGVILGIEPDARIVDITHGIAPGAVLQAAIVQRNALPYMPVGVHLAVVDPGVGSARRSLVLRDADGRLHVGPDNGLLVLAAELAGIEAAHELTNPAFALETVSRTFHGRDLFAPAAAYLARGVDPAELGPPVDVDSLVRVDFPAPEVGPSRIRATVVYVDRFGNVALNLTRDHLEHADVVPGRRVELQRGSDRYYAIVARTFADARPGELILYEDAYRSVALAISRGSAASLLGVGPGRELLIRVETA